MARATMSLNEGIVEHTIVKHGGQQKTPNNFKTKNTLQNQLNFGSLQEGEDVKIITSSWKGCADAEPRNTPTN